MFYETWKSIYYGDGRLNEEAFQKWLQNDACQKIGQYKGLTSEFRLKPGKTLMLLIGPSGAGKTTYASMLINRYMGKACIVSFDFINLEYIMRGHSVEEAEKLTLENFEMFVMDAREKHELVLIDGSLISFDLRSLILKTFEDKFDTVVGVFFDAPYQKLVQVDMKRSNGRPKFAERLYEEWSVAQALKEEPAILMYGVDELYLKRWKE